MTTNAITSTFTGSSRSSSFSATDEAFFRMTASLFPPHFVFGASVLLGTYDDEVESHVPATGSTAGQPVRPTVPAATPSAWA